MNTVDCGEDRVEYYRVYTTSDIGPARQIDDEELLQSCQNPGRPEEERLIFKRKNSAPSILEGRQAQNDAIEQQTLLKNRTMANNMGKIQEEWHVLWQNTFTYWWKLEFVQRIKLD